MRAQSSSATKAQDEVATRSRLLARPGEEVPLVEERNPDDALRQRVDVLTVDLELLTGRLRVTHWTADGL